MEIAIKNIEEHFETKTAPDGSAWQEWSESYEAFGEANNIAGLLEQTDEMKEGVTSKSSFEVTPNQLIFTGAGAPDRWLWHQEGRFRSRGGELPARPFVGLDDAAQEEVEEIFDLWVAGIISFFVSSTGAVHFRTPTGQIGPRVGR